MNWGIGRADAVRVAAEMPLDMPLDMRSDMPSRMPLDMGSRYRGDYVE